MSYDYQDAVEKYAQARKEAQEARDEWNRTRPIHPALGRPMTRQERRAGLRAMKKASKKGGN